MRPISLIMIIIIILIVIIFHHQITWEWDENKMKERSSHKVSRWHQYNYLHGIDPLKRLLAFLLASWRRRFNLFWYPKEMHEIASTNMIATFKFMTSSAYWRWNKEKWHFGACFLSIAATILSSLQVRGLQKSTCIIDFLFALLSMVKPRFFFFWGFSLGWPSNYVFIAVNVL